MKTYKCWIVVNRSVCRLVSELVENRWLVITTSRYVFEIVSKKLE